MLKSVFVKYISAFMLINILSIFLSTSIITTLVNTFDENNKTRNLAKVNYAVASYMIDDYTDSGENSFSAYLDDSVYKIIPVLDTIALSEDDLLIFVADGNGNVRLVRGQEHAGAFAGDDGIISGTEQLTLPQSVVAEMKKADSLSRHDDLDGFFTDSHMTYMQPIVASEGKTVGMVMTCSMSTDMDELLEAMIRTIVMSMLWLMLAALIAVYFITERLVSPIRDMSKAAREFAGGQFDVRVQVNGNDEVSELADAFNNMANSLQHSDETRRLFLANVSHDLRTPMTTIRGYIDSILSGAIKGDMIPHYLEVISGEVQRLSRLVSSLLDITRIQAGERKFNVAPFDICEMAREIIIFSEQRLEDKKLDVEFDADRDNMFVGGDREAIHQVLSNICDNAIKFSREKGKYIVSIKDSGSKTVVSVYNEGDGIPEEDLPYVFDRFYKGDKSRGLDKTGVGLGLYISRTIIEAHREKIKVESEYGKWCRFTFTLPRVNPPKPAASREMET
ncbi:MAG: HAMP domain-containing histidine kinase [Clostridia bacterium]|nr:HAMP domain-containing histidine kinase [Clostridia bacterium]